MAPQDATMYWLADRTRNDLFLLYCFDDAGQSLARLRAQIARRAAASAALCVRARDVPGDLDYPSWAPCVFDAEQVVEHPLAQPDWQHLEQALGSLVGTVLDAAVHPWRLHVFRGIAGAPEPRGGEPEADRNERAPIEPALVLVLQMSHALADGRRAAELARTLFTGPEDAPAGRRRGLMGKVVDASRAYADAVLAVPRIPIGMVRTAYRGYGAFRAQRELAALTAAGELPQPGAGFAPNRVNGIGAAGGGAHRVRMLVYAASALRVPGRTVTVVVLTAVSLALSRYLEARGERVARLGAQVPMALSDEAKAEAHNNYRSLSVDLCADVADLCTRADEIAATLHERRRRARHPLLTAQDRVTAVVPAPLLRRDIARYPIDIVPDSVAGHTVVSSVHRGPADLVFGAGRVRFTAGFPAIGSVMRLTHGVHGLGDTLTVSVHADDATVPDLDVYTERLRAALDEVVHRLRR